MSNFYDIFDNLAIYFFEIFDQTINNLIKVFTARLKLFVLF